jgi:hypothetical protein
LGSFWLSQLYQYSKTWQPSLLGILKHLTFSRAMAADKPKPPIRHMTPLELMRHRNDLMHSKASICAGRSFAPRPTDVFIVTYPK